MSDQDRIDARTRAETRSKMQAARDADARKVVEEVNAASAAERAKTARLRALRLAREEADRAAALAAPPSRKKAPARKAAAKADASA